MAIKGRYGRKPSHGRRAEETPRPVAVPRVPSPPKVYGKPFIILEDDKKATFEFRNGAWAPYTLTIAQCRSGGEVRELPQKINNMTRYEVRLLVS